jgi:prolyl-tRNA synthetase
MVETPGATTIQSLASMLGIDPQDTLKALFFVTEHDDLVFVMLRGDREVSLTKLASVTGCEIAGRATEAVIRESGAEPGYASPVGLRIRTQDDDDGILVVGDLSLLEAPSFVAGANKPGYHLVGVNHPRDFQVTHLADIAAARDSDPCPDCGQLMAEAPVVVLAQWTTTSGAFNFTDSSGKPAAGVMAIGTVFLDALLGALLAAHSDERGAGWPGSIAPYPVHLVSLGQAESAEPYVMRLLESGLDVLWDDREASPGVKFSDADLIGCPVRVTVSRRSIEKGGAEVSRRGGGNPQVVSVETLLEAVNSLI